MRWIGVLAVIASTFANADTVIGDPKAGHQFARDHCADCHYVEKEWSGFSPFMAPAFVDIAADPKYTALAIRVFLRTPHLNMPDFILTAEQTDNVISYILSLKTEEQ